MKKNSSALLCSFFLTLSLNASHVSLNEFDTFLSEFMAMANNAQTDDDTIQSGINYFVLTYQTTKDPSLVHEKLRKLAALATQPECSTRCHDAIKSALTQMQRVYYNRINENNRWAAVWLALGPAVGGGLFSVKLSRANSGYNETSKSIFRKWNNTPKTITRVEENRLGPQLETYFNELGFSSNLSFEELRVAFPKLTNPQVAQLKKNTLKLTQSQIREFYYLLKQNLLIAVNSAKDYWNTQIQKLMNEIASLVEKKTELAKSVIEEIAKQDPQLEAMVSELNRIRRSLGNVSIGGTSAIESISNLVAQEKELANKITVLVTRHKSSPRYIMTRTEHNIEQIKDKINTCNQNLELYRENLRQAHNDFNRLTAEFQTVSFNPNWKPFFQIRPSSEPQFLYQHIESFLREITPAIELAMVSAKQIRTLTTPKGILIGTVPLTAGSSLIAASAKIELDSAYVDPRSVVGDRFIAIPENTSLERSAIAVRDFISSVREKVQARYHEVVDPR